MPALWDQLRAVQLSPDKYSNAPALPYGRDESFVCSGNYVQPSREHIGLAAEKAFQLSIKDCVDILRYGKTRDKILCRACGC